MQLLAGLHRWLGAFMGLLLVVLALSGTALLWENAWIKLRGAGDRLVADPVQIGQAVEAATKADGGADTGSGAGTLARITFADEGLGLHLASYEDGGGAYLTQDGAIVARWSTMWQRPELWLFDLHHHLLAGEAGEIVTGVLGLLLAGFTVTGLILWWRVRGKFRLRAWPQNGSRSAFIRHHRDLGAAASPLLLLISLTGALMVFNPLSQVLLASFAQPDASASALPEAGPVDAQTDWPRLLATASAAFPEAQLRRLQMPGAPGDPVVIRMKQSFEWTPNGRSYVRIDPATYRILATEDPGQDDTASRIEEKYYPLHAGKVGGWPWRLALSAAGLALALLGVLAFWSFWRGRLRKRPAPKA